MAEDGLDLLRVWDAVDLGQAHAEAGEGVGCVAGQLGLQREMSGRGE